MYIFYHTRNGSELVDMYQDPENDRELEKMIQETNRINRLLKKKNLCIHETINWVSKFEQLGKCQDCQDVKTKKEFREDQERIDLLISNMEEVRNG